MRNYIVLRLKANENINIIKEDLKNAGWPLDIINKEILNIWRRLK